MLAFSEISEKITKTTNSEACFSEARSERLLDPFWVDFGNIFEGFGHPKWEKMRSRNQVKKRVAKKSREGVQGDPEAATNGGGVP